MSPRKKNTGKSGPFNQSTINTFFSAKSKHASTSTRPKRLAQSSLTARPLRSKRSPDPEEILDLTHSTSPVREPESPPSAKKRKLRATSPDQSPISGAEEESSPMGRSTSPALQNTTKPGPSTSVQPMSVSPAPSQTGRSHTMLDIDPDEVVESSQTQYLNVWFTPSSQRTFHMDLGRVPAPVFAPISTRTSQEGQEPSPTRETPEPSNLAEESQPTAFIPSSQGEVSEPYTPKKRNRTWLDQSGTDTQVPSGAMPPNAQEPNIIDRLAGTPKRQRPANGIPAPAHAVWASTPISNRVGPANPFTPHFSSPRPIPSPMYPSGRSDMIPSSQGEPSLEATEMGTVESPPKTAKYPADAIVPTFRVPPPAPIVQDTLHTRPRATTPLMPISNININAPRTPQRAAEQVPSSPSDFPSPGRLMSSLGFEGPRATKNVPLSYEGPTLSEVNGVEKCTRPHALSAPPCPEDGADDRVPKATDSQVHGEDSPARSQSSSQTVVPSSQPIHDSSPPPDYDLDPQRHAFNQGRLQSFNRPPVPVQPPAGFDSRFPSNSSRPYFTAQTHQSPSSSQSLPPSQSPIKGGRFDPNLSAAGVRGVFGMLGFGSEADSHEAQTGQRQGNNDGGNDSHTPVAYDLPPSSPPPQTPTRYESRESKRVRGVSVHRPIIYGNYSVLLTPTERGAAPPDHTHRWTVAVRSAASLEGKTDQTGGADDLTHFIKRVNFKLHETYTQPNRSIETPPFEITETGWGEFDIPIRITFVSESGEKAITLIHHLKLHPWLPPATLPDATGAAVTAPPTRDPIHAWQYDEIVFTDPPAAFMKILLEHPPTPLPKIKRRPANPPHIAHPASLAMTARGAPEFSLALEKEEAERLEVARKNIAEQTDKVRVELIETEKEVEKLKAAIAELEG
ncbi:unnamed protein product [Rhizoctonia solani]|uniref:YEATS domain-containing protein n=1 Tax=Rhizoctonia solani TaxID=456999 RepID=A0A8H3I2P2_9AGAM|nr:unnamed protein product [Rhizoctonia solani]